jgi:Protein of unknown function (DUF1264)
MNRPPRVLPRLRGALPVLLACAASAAAGAFVGAGGLRPRAARAEADPAAQPHVTASPTGVKAPIREVLHCPLAFAGVHLLKEMPEWSQVAYHFCKPVNADLNQCVLYDGTGPDARLIGIEYLVSDAVYQKMPAEERVYWHDHKYEVDAGLLRSITQTGEDEKKTLAVVRTLWGKVYHTWASGRDYPRGPARLYWSVTGEPPFVLSPDAKLPPELSGKVRPDGR